MDTTLKNKTVLVTGADGFIGSHLTEKLVKECRSVKALVQYNSFNSWGWLDDSPVCSQIEVIAGDIRDAGFCQKLVEGSDVVFHLAALIAIPYSYTAPESFLETNVMGTHHICSAAKEKGVERMIVTSTSEVYGTAKSVPMTESHPLQPQSPYSASKIGADAIAMSFYHSFKTPISIARPFNTYGPRQSARAIIPTLISQLAAKKTKIKVGNTAPTRDFNFVMDTCNALVAIAQSTKTIGEVVNIGSGTEISVGELFTLLCDLMSTKAELTVEDIRTRPTGSEVERLLCDNSKLKSLTPWTSHFDLKKGLVETINWFQNPQNLAKYKTDIYNV